MGEQPVTKMPETEFEKAVLCVKLIPKDGDVKPSNDTRLRFYALFKQATIGDCNEDCPTWFFYVARRKWEAWNAIQGKDAEECKKDYVEELDKTSGSHDWRKWLEDELAGKN